MAKMNKKVIRRCLIGLDKLGALIGMGKGKALPAADEIKRVLILELWGIGDVVLSTVGLQGIKKIYPNAQVFFLAQSYSEQLLLNCNLVDKFFCFKFPWTKPTHKYQLWKYPWIKIVRLIKEIRKLKIDLAIDARTDIRNNFLLWLLGVKQRIAYADAGGGFFLTRQIHQPENIKHRVEKWQYLLTCLGYQGEAINPKLCLNKSETILAQEWKKHHAVDEKKFLIGIHPGAAHPIRRWPMAKYLNVMLAIDKEFNNIQWVVFGEAACAEADWLVTKYPQAVRVTGDLRNYLAITNICDLMILNDSGPMHMVAALGRSLIAIFGPQKKEWFGPWGKNSHVIERPGITCRGCFDRCIHSEPICMEISSEEVILKVKEIIRK